MITEVTPVCKDYLEREGCLKEIDEQWTMKFEDINEGCIYFCSHCGPLNHEMLDILEHALKTGQITNEQLDAAIAREEDKMKKG